MKEIAAKLIEYGIDFQYENFGSEGEKIISMSTSIEINRQNGKIFFHYEDKCRVWDDVPENIPSIVNLAEAACLSETN